MKKHHTPEMIILICSGKYTYFAGPKYHINSLIKFLSKKNFTPINKISEGSLPWEVIAADRIHKYTKPGLALKGARARDDMTQQELAKKLKVKQYNISKMENGKRPIGKAMAKKLAKIFNVGYKVFL